MSVGTAVRAVVIGGVLCLASGCVSVRVEPLTQQHYPPRNGHEPVQVLAAEPDASSIRLARITATSQTADEDTLRDRILARAGQLGADAVIMGKVDVLESMGSGPLYESTLSPAGTGYGSSGWGFWGWWDPFYLDPWSYVQGAADQQTWTIYLSGLAIRYDQAVERPAAPVNRDHGHQATNTGREAP